MRSGCPRACGEHSRRVSLLRPGFTFQLRTETSSTELGSTSPIHRGDNSRNAITTAGASITTEFNTHISDPAAIWSFNGVRKQIRGASAYDEYSTFPANASVADNAVFTMSALNR
jgi:hypothetical protein